MPISPRKKIITGWWDNLPIWRYETPEEILKRERIKPEVANLYIALNEK